MKKALIPLALCSLLASPSFAGVDSDYKERPTERFTIYAGDGHYKQAYHWSFNEDGEGSPVTIFLNHGSGGEWYDEIENEYTACGPDYLSDNNDFAGTDYAGLCELDNEGNRLYLADFESSHVPVGPELSNFMTRKIVGSTQFAAWYWQNAFQAYDSPVHIFMVGRYNIATDPSHLDNALFWLNTTDINSVTYDTLPPYNLDGYGIADIDLDDRPMHTSPTLAGFDNVFLYKAVKEQYPEVSLDNLLIEGRSNGGSAMIALASDPSVWPQEIEEFWARNLPLENNAPEVMQIEGVTLNDVFNNPALSDAFNTMLANYTEEDLLAAIDDGELSLTVNDMPVAQNAGEYIVEQNNDNNTGYDADTYFEALTNYVHGDFYDSAKFVHAFYPGCSLGGIMQKDENLPLDVKDTDGDNASGYQVRLPMLMSFADEDSLYTDACNERVEEAQDNTEFAGVLAESDISNGDKAVIGKVYTPARHGFDYKDVYKNLDGYSDDNQLRAGQSREAIENAVNQAIKQLGVEGTYTLPANLEN